MSARVSPANARAAVAVGVVVVVAALLVAGPLFGPSPYALVPLLVGALTLAAGASLAPAGGAGVSFRKVAKWAAVAAPLAAGVLLSHFLKFEIDVTHARVNTLADESLAVAAALPQPVRVVSFVPAGDRADVELRALVQRYTAANPAVSFEARSVKRAADLEVAQALDIAALLPLGGPNVVVVGSAPGAPADDSAPAVVRLRVDAGSGNLEETLTNALAQVARNKTRARVYVTAGHDDARLRDEGPLGLSQLATFARARGVDLVPLPLSLLEKHGVPDDARALWVLPHKGAIFMHEAVSWRGAVRKHAAWIAADADGVDPVVVDSAGDVGVSVLADVVVDEGGFGSVFGVDTLSGSSQMAHPITRTLAGALTHFPRAAPLAISAMDGVDAVPVVSTSGDAVAKNAGMQGPMPILVATTASDGRRAVVSGDVSFCENGSIGLGSNRDLALNTLLWLVADEDAIAVRPRAKTGALLFLTPSARARLTFALVFLVPVVVAAAAAASAARRRG
jgi:hypothetical protein